MAKYEGENWQIDPVSLPTLNFQQFDPHLHLSKSPNTSQYSRLHKATIYSHDPDDPRHERMGDMDWSPSTGEIASIGVHPKFQRLGVANTLFHESRRLAREQGITPPEHSSDRSKQGDAWAKQTGTPIPKKKKF